MFIYVIVNSVTLKIYVGQHRKESLTRYLQQKWWDAHHYSGKRSHLYASMRKYPRECWSIHPLISGIEDKKELDEAEQLLIYALKAQHPDVGYNICDGGEGFTGTHSPETIAKCKIKIKESWDRYSPEERTSRGKTVGDAQRGVPKPDGFGEKISEALTGRTWTPEQREKIPSAIQQAIADGTMLIHQFTPQEMEKAHQAAANKLRGVRQSPELVAARQTPEARKKRGDSLRGQKHSEESRANMSEGKKKDWAHRKNRTFSLDRNAKISYSMKGKVPVEALKKAHSPETEENRQNTRFLKTVAYG